MRKIALFSDIHANPLALDAVFESIDEAGIEERYCLGDLVGYGPDPGGVVERMRSSQVPVIRGNYDQGVGDRSGSCGCYYPTDQAKSDGAASYEFTARATSDTDAIWLTQLPESIRLAEADVRVLLTHGSPRRINEYLMPDRGERQLARLATEAEADVVCCGHIHIPYHRSFYAETNGSAGPVVHYVNSGSVGKPRDGDPRACWVELAIGSAEEVHAAAPTDKHVAPAGETETWVGLRIHRVPYDVEAVAKAVIEAGLPATFAEALREG